MKTGRKVTNLQPIGIFLEQQINQKAVLSGY